MEFLPRWFGIGLFPKNRGDSPQGTVWRQPVQLFDAVWVWVQLFDAVWVWTNALSLHSLDLGVDRRHSCFILESLWTQKAEDVGKKMEWFLMWFSCVPENHLIAQCARSWRLARTVLRSAARHIQFLEANPAAVPLTDVVAVWLFGVVDLGNVGTYGKRGVPDRLRQVTSVSSVCHGSFKPTQICAYEVISRRSFARMDL